MSHIHLLPIDLLNFEKKSCFYQKDWIAQSSQGILLRSWKSPLHRDLPSSMCCTLEFLIVCVTFLIVCSTSPQQYSVATHRFFTASSIPLFLVNPFRATSLFRYPQKISGNQKFSDVFRRYRNRLVAWNGLILVDIFMERNIVCSIMRSVQKPT